MISAGAMVLVGFVTLLVVAARCFLSTERRLPVPTEDPRDDDVGKLG